MSVSVVIPVGPDEIYLEYLEECLLSVLNQTSPPSEIIIINDKNRGLCPFIIFNVLKSIGQVYPSGLKGVQQLKVRDYPDVQLLYYETLWNVGVADAFNFGVQIAGNSCIFMVGSDDKMHPRCLELCYDAWVTNGKKDAWYNVTNVTAGGEEGWIPNNTAMVTKGLWYWLGGFPPSAGVGACDALALSILMKHAPDKIVQVKQGEPLCWLREGDYQDTRKNAMHFNPEIISIRNKETERWQPPK